MKVFNKKKQKVALIIDKIMSFYLIKKKKIVCRTLLVFDFHLIGDIVLLTALLKALRLKYKKVQIILVCGEWGATILEKNPFLSDFILIFNTP